MEDPRKDWVDESARGIRIPSGAIAKVIRAGADAVRRVILWITLRPFIK